MQLGFAAATLFLSQKCSDAFLVCYQEELLHAQCKELQQTVEDQAAELAGSQVQLSKAKKALSKALQSLKNERETSEQGRVALEEANRKVQLLSGTTQAAKKKARGVSKELGRANSVSRCTAILPGWLANCAVQRRCLACRQKRQAGSAVLIGRFLVKTLSVRLMAVQTRWHHCSQRLQGSGTVMPSLGGGCA